MIYFPLVTLATAPEIAGLCLAKVLSGYICNCTGDRGLDIAEVLRHERILLRCIMGNRQICGRFNRSHTHLEDSRRSLKSTIAITTITATAIAIQTINLTTPPIFPSPISRPWRFFWGQKSSQNVSIQRTRLRAQGSAWISAGHGTSASPQGFLPGGLKGR